MSVSVINYSRNNAYDVYYYSQLCGESTVNLKADSSHTQHRVGTDHRVSWTYCQRMSLLFTCNWFCALFDFVLFISDKISLFETLSVITVKNRRWLFERDTDRIIRIVMDGSLPSVLFSPPPTTPRFTPPTPLPSPPRRPAVVVHYMAKFIDRFISEENSIDFNGLQKPELFKRNFQQFWQGHSRKCEHMLILIKMEPCNL